MSRVSSVNLAAMLAAMTLSVALASGHASPRGAGRAAELTDATGARIELHARRRIASGSTVADRLLLELCDPTRVVAFTAASAAGPERHRYAGRPTVESIDHTERLIGLRPDLLLVHNVADARRVERLREAGLEVFDLGELRGRASLREDAEQIAALCGSPGRGARWARTFERRLDAIARAIPPGDRRSAIYLSVYGDRLFGGTTGTSYHDVLVAAGLRDAASERFEGWPQYTVEQLLELDPDVLVTRDGMYESFCAHPVLARLSACPEQVVEIDPALLDAPGPGMLDAAEAVHDAVYGAPSR